MGTKPVDLEQNHYTGTPQPQPGYYPNAGQQPYDANANQYGNHQNEYNTGYNAGGYNANTGYNAQQSYAPPSGPPAMPAPSGGHY